MKKKQPGTLVVTIDEQCEGQEPMIADNTADIRKIQKVLNDADLSGIENDIGKWSGHLTKAVVDYLSEKGPKDLLN